jgi:GNAT superfamily N-acetyltransferase
MIEIRTLNKAQLETYIHSDIYVNAPFLPISKHRALSHIKNPRAGSDDVLLLLAYEGNVLVGYLGALPDHIFNANGQFETCAWLSCMWIDERHRGKKIAQQLLQKCFEVWHHKILVTEFTEAAKKLYDKTGVFDDLKINIGIRLYLRSDFHKLLPPKKALFDRYKPIFKVFDILINMVLDLRFLLLRRKKYQTELIREIDQETEQFIQTRQEGQIFRRGKDDLNWILNNPWILAGEEDEMSRRYHFSSVDKSFDFYAMKLRDENHKMIAFLIFAKRNKSLKLPYCYVDAEHITHVAGLLEEQLITWRINTFTCFHPGLAGFLSQNDTIAIFKKPVRRHYIISKQLKTFVGDTSRVVIQDGDADAAFT